MTTSVAKIIIIKQPVIAGLTRNPLNNQGMLKQVQHDAYGIPSATEVVLFLELGKNKVSSHRSSIPLGMHRISWRCFEDLIERIENLEAQVEELYTHLEIPFDIPFNDYSLEETNCMWKLFSPPWSEFPIIDVINSEEDLEQFICTYPGQWDEDDFLCDPCLDYPGIDFSKKTLLFAQGVLTTKVWDSYCTGLQKISSLNYEMTVILFVSFTMQPHFWHVPIIINKLDEGSNVELIVTYSLIN